MQSTNEIRHHIGAVRQTRKITNAMELVSSARIKKAMQHIEYNRRYFLSVQQAMKDILLSPHPVTHPYLRTGLEGRRVYIVIAGDKGMVGSYNAEILGFAQKEIEKAPDSILITVGVVAEEYFRRHGHVPEKAITGISQDPSLFSARRLMQDITSLYEGHEARSVYLIYTTFEREAPGAPVLRRILPIRIHDYEMIPSANAAHEILYVPSADEVFGRLVPQYLLGLLYAALVQAYAGEHYARMNTMKSATDNADELLKKLDLQYNIARQTAITQEIAEITGATLFQDGK